MRKRLPTRKCLGEPHSFEDFSFCIPQTSGERGSFPIPLSVCVLFQLLRRKQGLGVGMTAMGGFCPPWVLGWHLMLGRCGIWLGKRGEQSVFFFFHITEETQGGDLSCLKTPPLLQPHLPRFPFYNQPCRRRCISCKLEKPGPLSLGSVLIKFSCKIQVQFPYL